MIIIVINSLRKKSTLQISYMKFYIEIVILIAPKWNTHTPSNARRVGTHFTSLTSSNWKRIQLKNCIVSFFSGRVGCPQCPKTYKGKNSLWRHLKFECGKDPKFECPYCGHKTKQKIHLQIHIAHSHNVFPSKLKL